MRRLKRLRLKVPHAFSQQLPAVPVNDYDCYRYRHSSHILSATQLHSHGKPSLSAYEHWLSRFFMEWVEKIQINL
jgi:hypothetical protein